MRKLKIFTFLMLSIVPLFSFAQDLYVEVIDMGRCFQINMRTYQNQESICQLKLARVDIRKPTFSQDGIIYLQISLDPYKKCLNTIGPYEGSFIFRRGADIPIGRYFLYINDEDYGFLYIFEDRIYFDPINCL